MTAENIRRVAVHALLAVASSDDAPAAARAQAARSLLELLGDLGPRAIPLAEREVRGLQMLTRGELERELSFLENERSPTKSGT